MGVSGSADLDRERAKAAKNRDKLESGKRSMEFLCCGGGSVAARPDGVQGEQAGTMAAAAASVVGQPNNRSGKICL